MKMMRVMTFNLRFENDQDGSNAWNYRRHLVVKLIGQYGPDILGTQEGRVSQLNYLKENLSGYQMHTPSRVLDDTCQYPTLFFRKERFRIMEGNEFWLSKTPEIHRSKNWDSAFPRMMSNATVELSTSGQVFSVAVTHLDHMGGTARLKQAEIIARWAHKKTVPVILMGDFNDGPDSEAHRALVNKETRLSDSWNELGHSEGKESFTHHAFTGIPQKSRIDWILTTVPPYVLDARIVHDQFDERYVSDHFPYCVDLSWRIPK
jgi:endonuclease/exonuclease/phosphatase family metal-dependent hydrolase